MLKFPVLHPELIKSLALCGHGDLILIADGNYPLDSATNLDATKIYLNLTHGIPSVTQVLEVLLPAIKIEKAQVMRPEDSVAEPEIFGEFRHQIGPNHELESLDRFSFYEACRLRNVRLAIATGDQRTYANILLTVGVV
jgi:L-fucose mutarotase